MRSPGRWWPLVVGLVLVAPGSVDAQQRPPRSPDRARMEAQFRQRFDEMVQRELQLDDATSEALRERIRGFMPRRQELARGRRALQREMGTETELSDERARELLQEMVRFAREEAQLLADEQESLLELLSPEQVVRLYALREHLGRRIRELGGRGPGRGPGGSPPLW